MMFTVNQQYPQGPSFMTAAFVPTPYVQYGAPLPPPLPPPPPAPLPSPPPPLQQLPQQEQQQEARQPQLGQVCTDIFHSGEKHGEAWTGQKRPAWLENPIPAWTHPEQPVWTEQQRPVLLQPDFMRLDQGFPPWMEHVVPMRSVQEVHTWQKQEMPTWPKNRQVGWYEQPPYPEEVGLSRPNQSVKSVRPEPKQPPAWLENEVPQWTNQSRPVEPGQKQNSPWMDHEALKAIWSRNSILPEHLNARSQQVGPSWWQQEGSSWTAQEQAVRDLNNVPSRWPDEGQRWAKLKSIWSKEPTSNDEQAHGSVEEESPWPKGLTWWQPPKTATWSKQKSSSEKKKSVWAEPIIPFLSEQEWPSLSSIEPVDKKKCLWPELMDQRWMPPPDVPPLMLHLIHCGDMECAYRGKPHLHSEDSCWLL